jgi:threonine aldolase
MGGRIAGTHAMMCHCCLPCPVAHHETAAGLGAVPGAELMRPPRPTTIVTRTERSARLAGHGVRVLPPPSC